MHHAFLYNSFFSLQDYNNKGLVSRFVERENARQRLWFSLPKLR